MMIRKNEETRNSRHDPPPGWPPLALLLLAGISTLHEALEDGFRALKTRPALYTREEAADLLRISTRTLDDLAATGEICPTRIRGRVLYRPDDIDAYIRSVVDGEDGLR